MVHIVGISGSLRKASVHSGILRAIAKNFPAGHTFDLVVPDLPLFNSDLEPHLPQAVKDFRARLKKADGFIFASTEYNFGISSPMKNAIDWGSRGDKDGNLFNDKAGGAISGGGGLGGHRSVLHLNDCAVYVNMHMMNHPQVNFRIFENKIFDPATGDLVDEKAEAAVQNFLKFYINWAVRIHSSRSA
jgi:NAD(P)H-dependent FMN reductase